MSDTAAHLLSFTIRWSIVPARNRKSSMPERSDTLVRDRLALQRTELANERTLLSYIRTALGFCRWNSGCVVAGGARISHAGCALVTGVLFLGIGVWRFVTSGGDCRQPD